MENKHRVLVLAPHTDDGELGCGASVCRFLEEGKEVYYVAFSLCEDSVPSEFPRDILGTELKKATAELGIKPEKLIIKNYPVRRFDAHRQDILEDLIALKKQIKPDLVFTPSSFDIHQDHKVIFEESQRAFKNTSILGYEFMWNSFSFNSTAFVSLEQKHVEAKVRAMDRYESQKRRFYTKEALIMGQANYRGLQLSQEYAEAFEVIRWII